MGKLLDGKVGIIYGVANQRSIAWAIAKAASNEGAKLCVTYQSERLAQTVVELASQLQDAWAIQCDVTDDAQIERVYNAVDERYGRLEFIVHSVAFARREELSGSFINTSRDGFITAMDVSAYSLIAVTRPALRLMQSGGSVVTLTYIGSERAMPNYNVMGVCKAALEAIVRYLAFELGERGIRVNALSPGPIPTLAARGISGFTQMYQRFREVAPMRRNTEADEVADAALFLLSDMSRGITGEIVYVDQGFHIVGLV
ncbi:MAG: enoyl-ACP reductase [Armatimonadota bacterium]|nr:enoyl-ACP reductase [Armatimonadota bacterium]MCX7776709.1 enoyl-ACP reductase [Armatimonadota bacterium]MDW8026655.1 enoyl-ACP reductase [Armatimonadota bacterium]